MSPYRQMAPMPVPPPRRWGATALVKLMVRLRRRHYPFRCRAHGMFRKRAAVNMLFGHKCWRCVDTRTASMRRRLARYWRAPVEVTDLSHTGFAFADGRHRALPCRKFVP